jgi:hypothetical protein
VSVSETAITANRVFGLLSVVLNGLVHLFGLVVSWRLVTTADMPYSTTVLPGKFDLGEAGIRFVGFLWLAAAAGFVIAGIGLFILAPGWLAVTLAVTLFSLVLYILE